MLWFQVLFYLPFATVAVFMMLSQTKSFSCKLACSTNELKLNRSLKLLSEVEELKGYRSCTRVRNIVHVY